MANSGLSRAISYLALRVSEWGKGYKLQRATQPLMALTKESAADEDTREIAVEAWNLVFGKVLFTFLRLPVDWVTGYQINDPLVCDQFLYKNLVWAGTGETEVLISRRRIRKERPEHDFTLKVVVDLQKNGPVAPSPKDLAGQHKKQGHQVLRSGRLTAGGHAGSYVLSTSTRRRFGILGRPQLIAKLEAYIPCTETTRLLALSWTSPSSKTIIDCADELIASLNSVLCHGHDVQPSEEWPS